MSKLPGKKIDVLVVKAGAQSFKVDLRLEQSRGLFYAELGGEVFSGLGLKELRAQLAEKAKAMTAYVFSWFIVVNLSIGSGNQRGSTWQTTPRALPSLSAICGLSFNFEVVERSQPFIPQDAQRDARPARLTRTVTITDGVPTASGEHRVEPVYENGDNDSFPYTPERYAKLLAIQRAFRELVMQLHTLCGGDGENVAAQLDARHLSAAFTAQVLPLMLTEGKD